MGRKWSFITLYPLIGSTHTQNNMVEWNNSRQPQRLQHETSLPWTTTYNNNKKKGKTNFENFARDFLPMAQQKTKNKQIKTQNQ
jgi:hypothetical protein